MTKKEKTSTEERPPIIVVMGHVDHGKSTLLDYIRKSNIVEGEAGGITQHVAAYEVEHEHEGKSKRITFIDTPGHAAFKNIRSRGAKIADIAILVVAADDGVKAQTIEALESIRESKIPFVVAVNKIDKPNADIERTKTSLLENEIYLEGLGGEIPYSTISAKSGEGIPELLDLVLIAAELEELKGDSSKLAEGYVAEAHRDPKRGIAATLIITDGSMKSGQVVCAANSTAPLRIMHDHAGKQIKEAHFSSPVTVIGFDTMPEVGASFQVYKNKKEAEAAKSGEKNNESSNAVVSEGENGEIHTMPIVIKADVAGSLEAVLYELENLSSEWAQVKIVQSGIGNISEADVKSAIASGGAMIIGFNVNVDSTAVEPARQHSISIETFSIIYELTQEVESLLKKSSPKRKVENIIGHARVIKLFSKQKDVYLIGGSVTDGELRKKTLARVMRGKSPVGIGEILSIQSGKQTVDRVEKDSEFGAQIEADFEIAPNDMLECFVIKED